MTIQLSRLSTIIMLDSPTVLLLFCTPTEPASNPFQSPYHTELITKDLRTCTGTKNAENRAAASCAKKKRKKKKGWVVERKIGLVQFSPGFTEGLYEVHLDFSVVGFRDTS